MSAFLRRRRPRPFPLHRSHWREAAPALVVSHDNDRRLGRVVCVISSVPREGSDLWPLAPGDDTGLTVPSVVRFDTLATLDRSVIAGRIGTAPPAWLAAQASTFFAAFGFDRC